MARRYGGTAYVYFAYLKAAFDNVDRKEIVKMMEEVGLGRGLRRAIEKIYEETKFNCDRKKGSG